MDNNKLISLLGRLASGLSVLMYVSYIPQIMSNLDGMKGNPVQPFVAMINCIVWTLYGTMKKEKDLAIIVANVPGIFLGLITFVTSL